VVVDAAVSAPTTLADRQSRLWSTPHGVVKAALAGRGSMQGRTIAFAVPGRFRATATVDARSRHAAGPPRPSIGGALASNRPPDSLHEALRDHTRASGALTTPAARTDAPLEVPYAEGRQLHQLVLLEGVAQHPGQHRQLAVDRAVRRFLFLARAAPSLLPPTPDSFDALVHRVDENDHVDGLVQDVVRASGQGAGHEGTVEGTGDHHDRHVVR
jgi:hypothetical protein